jgi:alpha-D-ribose 1-methylphosphonate 5-triphosphate synthase subunit PhnH
MDHNTIYPVYTAEESRNRETFLALMWALSYPGRVQHLHLSGNHLGVFSAIADALLDLETSYFTNDSALNAQLRHTGARSLPANRATYHFYTTITDADLDHIENANMGTTLYPDDSATLFLGCKIEESDSATTLVLEGPGVQKQKPMRLSFSGIPNALWALRQQVSVYPVGLDIVLVDPTGKVAGIPRSTYIVVERLGK